MRPSSGLRKVTLYTPWFTLNVALMEATKVNRIAGILAMDFAVTCDGDHKGV
jgi:hypothetical protein